MKRWLFCFALLAAAACGERQSQPQQLVVMTMNMRYDNPEDGENNWRFRRERIAAMLREQAPDVFGTQELLANYVNNTSPVQLVDHGDDAIDDRYGKVIPGREGEAWFLDEFGGFGKVALFAAPTAALAARFDTNPHRARQRSQATQRS